MALFFGILSILLNVLSFAILARVIMSWFSPASTNLFAGFLYQLTEPILAPLRRIIPMAGPFDFTPMVAIILLQIIGSLLSQLA